MDRSRKVLLIIGGCAIGAASVVAYAVPAVKSFIKDQQEIVGPANRLKSLKASSDDLMQGATTTKQKESTSPTLLASFANEFPQEAESISGFGSIENAQRLVTMSTIDPVVKSAINSIQTADLSVSPTSVLSVYDVRPIRVLGRALITRADSEFRDGNVSQGIESLKQAIDLAAYTAKVGEMQSVVTAFTIELEGCRSICEALTDPKRTTQDLQKIDTFLQNQPTQTTVLDSFKRHLQELYVAAGEVKQLTKLEIDTLNTEQINTTYPPNHPDLPAAMQVRLLEYYDAGKKSFEGAVDNEYAGILLDRQYREWIQNKGPSYYMIKTMGEMYEQIGRMVARVSQARHVAQITLYAVQQRISSGKYPDGIPAEMLDTVQGRDRVLAIYKNDGRDITIVCHSPVRDYDPDSFRRGKFDVSQECGVRYTIDPN